MLNKVTTYLIVGTLGVGKTTLLQQLLKQKPSNERWAILINEFGKVGVDSALLGEEQVTITEIAGGCLCCTNGAPFQVGLSKLLKEQRPAVLFIELSGLGHPQTIQKQLQVSPWQQVLVLQPLIQIVEAKQLTVDFVPYDANGLLIINKTEQISQPQKQKINQQLGTINSYWTTQSYLPLANLPTGTYNNTIASQPVYIQNSTHTDKQLAKDITCTIQQQAEGWAIGWCLQPNYCFKQTKLTAWLKQYHWIRAKLVVQTEEGWLSVNAVDKQFTWKVTEWRKDNRIELIFADKQAEQLLIESLLTCLN